MAESLDETLGAEPTLEGPGTERSGSGSPTRPEVGSGMRIGRYLALDKLGAGAMGVVWSAWDPELDRRVAIKLLRTSRSEDPSSDRIRLQREAQALARLSHPNVVTVFDVGTHGEQLFVAMECVEGQTLREWVAGVPVPSAHRRVSALVSAARGLAAAHGAGLIHRDFKPDNVMIDVGDRVRVMDFGLARESHAAAGDSSIPATSRPLSRSATLRGSASELTRVGALVGTPAYMAPEQFQGATADARTDQFSFCVSAWEVLCGSRPFAGENLAALAFAASEGHFESAPPGAMPTNVRRALERGLQADPSARWSDMAALIDALIADPIARRRRRVVTVLAGTALVAAMAGAWSMRSDALAECSDRDRQLAGTWDAGRREAVRLGLAASGSPLAESTHDALSQRLDAWSSRWVAVAGPACRGESTLAPELRTRQASCLALQRLDVEALVSLLERADVEMVRHALTAVESLPSPEACGDPIRLASNVAPPDSALSGEVEALRLELAQVRAERSAGSMADAERRVDSLLPRIESTGYAALEAEARFERGQIIQKRGASDAAQGELGTAAELALRAGDDALAARAMTLEAGVFGGREAGRASADVLLGIAEAIAQRLGDPDDLRRERVHVRAKVAYDRADYTISKDLFEHEIELLSASDPDGLLLGNAYSGLGAAQLGLGDFDGADASLLAARAHFERTLPAGHPSVASAIERQGALAYERGRIAEASELFSQAIELYTSALGADHPDTAEAKSNLAGMKMVQGDHPGAEALYREVLESRRRVLAPDDEAIGTALCSIAAVLDPDQRGSEIIALYEEGVAIIEKAKGAEHPNLAWVALNFATALRQAGDFDRAIQWGRRSLVIREKVLGPDHPHLAMSVHNVGETLVALGEFAEADQMFARANGIWLAVHGPDHPNLATGRASRGHVLVRLGRWADARVELEDARRMSEGQPGKAATVAYIDASLAAVELAEGRPGEAEAKAEAAIEGLESDASARAEALETLGLARWKLGDRERARVAIRSAAEGFAADPNRLSDRDRCEAWLGAH